MKPNNAIPQRLWVVESRTLKEVTAFGSA